MNSGRGILRRAERAVAAGVRGLAAWAVVALVGVVGVMAESARGQSAPAGNSHPQAEVLSALGERNPFGDAAAKSSADAEKKHAFAEQVDVRPLRDLSVYHSGRVKIIDSLARETIAQIMGRRDFYDVVNPDVGGGYGSSTEKGSDGTVRKYRKMSYDPVFTFFDMMIDPAYYEGRAIVNVGYRPLREMFLNAEFTDEKDAVKRESIKRTGRLSPEIIARHMKAIGSSSTTDQQVMRGLDEMRYAVQTYLNLPASMRVVASKSVDEQWGAIGQLPASHPVRVAAEKLGASWRVMDAKGVNEAIATLAAELPKINPETYPGARRAIERIYNTSSPFEWGMWLYAAAFLGLIIAFGTGRPWLKNLSTGLLVAAIAVHLVGFGARCFIAERYTIQNQYESMTGVSLFAALFGLGMMVFKRQMIFAAAAAGVGFLVLVTATQLPIPGKDINREAAILNTSILLKYHVTIVLLSYGLIALGMVVSCFYLGTYYAQKLRGGEATAGGGDGAGAKAKEVESVSATALGIAEQEVAKVGPARVLADLDKAQMAILQMAFWTLGVGILLGAWWADHSWGRWWAFDPKETWALVTWIVYLVVVHVRVAGGVGGANRGLTTAWLSIVGFIAMLWCYFGVNLLLPGLHAYA
ncbi:MAG: cytochrome c biogenesis protein CcsA [Phycisphaerales bacterium]|nr:cytochrome c biogenesis protein CcsA [Phycisphaerales bacterium]